MKHLMRVAIVVVAVAALLTTVSPADAAKTAATGSQATVSGTVGCTDGLAIPEASVQVSVMNKTGTYDVVATLTASGVGGWTYSGKAGDYRFVMSAPSADSQTHYLAMVNKGTYTLDTTLQGYGTIAGNATDALSGAPLDGVTVEFYRRNGDGTWPALPAASLLSPDGAYASPQLPTGVYAVCASKPTYRPTYCVSAETIDAANTLLVNRASSPTADIVVPPITDPGPVFGTISGHVYLNGSPMIAYVSFYKQNEDGTWPTPGYTFDVQTGAGGSYVSVPLPEGNYKVRFFGMHTGSLYWDNATTMGAATVLTIDTDGEEITGIDGWFVVP